MQYHSTATASASLEHVENCARCSSLVGRSSSSQTRFFQREYHSVHARYDIRAERNESGMKRIDQLKNYTLHSFPRVRAMPMQ